MDYSQYALSANSNYLPTLGECNKCPFVNKCHDGEKCLEPKKHRDRTAYYQAHKEAYKQRSKEQRQNIIGATI